VVSVVIFRRPKVDAMPRIFHNIVQTLLPAMRDSGNEAVKTDCRQPAALAVGWRLAARRQADR